MSEYEHLISLVILRHHPGWIPPDDNGRPWIRTSCPYHGDDTPSAAVSYQLQAYNCLACSARGDAIGLIKLHEEVTYQQAIAIATELSPTGVAALPQGPGRKQGRGAPSRSRSDRAGYRRGGDQVSPRVRGRSFTGP